MELRLAEASLYSKVRALSGKTWGLTPGLGTLGSLDSALSEHADLAHSSQIRGSTPPIQEDTVEASPPTLQWRSSPDSSSISFPGSQADN